MKLADRSLKYHIYPITQLKSIEQIFIVRDHPGLQIPKVQYYCPPKFFQKNSFLKVIYKLIIMLYLSLFKKPDVIHSYLLFPHGIIAFIVSKLTRKPIGISLIAGPVELYSLGGSPLGIKCTESLPWFGKILLKILKRCNFITTTGSFTTNFLVGLGIEKNKIYIMPHVIIGDKLCQINIPKKYDVISVGRLAPVKHVDILLKASRIVKKKYEDIQIGIVGDGPCRAYLEKLSQELDLTNNVQFIGYQENVEYYYNSSKISILTSEREGFPFTVVEAMSCGLPVITSNCGDIVDVAQNGFNSIVIDDYNNVNDFADAIINLLGNEEIYKKLSEKSSQIRNFDVGYISSIWDNILKVHTAYKIQNATI